MASFETMPGHARVWIYQADRELTAAEQALVNEAAGQFLGQWAAHGTPLNAAGQLLHGYFLVLAVDEDQAEASGCSIDKSVNFVKAIGAQLGIDFFNRLNIAIDTTGIRLVPMAEFAKMATEGEVTPETMVYDNTVTTMADFAQRWHTRAGNTWLKRYFSKQTA